MKTILIIEDIDITRELIVHTLKRDYHVLEASNGVDGLEITRQKMPDLILCDIAMPDMDGYQVIGELRKDDETAAIPFIFLTAFDEREAVRYGIELGADDYLTKPFTIEELRSAVKAGLKKRALHDKRLHQKMDELRNNITTALPHELRTVVMVLEGYLQVMMDDNSDDEDQSLLKTMNQYAERLHRMSDKFLWYTELQTGAVKAAQTPLTDPDMLITETATKHATLLGRQADLKLKLTPAAICIQADQLTIIVRELIENACLYSAPGTMIDVFSERNSTGYCLHVRDHGRGMTEDQIAQLGAFMQFERGTYEQQGTGLGLVIIRRLLELNQGHLAIKSEYGKSTEVVCHFTQPRSMNGSTSISQV